MSKAPNANSCVKCSLSGLGCSRVLRGAIDDLAVRIHLVAVRGTHLANHIIAEEVCIGATSGPLPNLPDVLEPKWWQQCFKAAANPRSGKEDVLHVTSSRMFGDGDVIRLGGPGTHAIETLAKDIVTNIHVMLTLNFHKQLRKAFRRDILNYAARRDFVFDAADRERLVDYCIWRCVQQDSMCKEVNFPLAERDPMELGIDLQAELDSKVDDWRLLYGPVLLCPMPSFISNMKSSEQKMQLFRWFVDLQRQRKRSQEEMTDHFDGDAENARKCFGKAAKAMRALPLSKLRVGHILVDRTLLKFLLLELQKAGEPISDLEIPLLTPVVANLDENGEPPQKRAKLNEDGTQKQTRNRRKGDDDAHQTELFWSHFPNAKRLLKGRKDARLDKSIRTDGISSSVPLIIPGRPESRAEMKEVKMMEKCCDLMPGNPTPTPRKPGQRLVAIDPGRRDMVFCYVKTDEAHETPSTCSSSTSTFFCSSQFFGISTRQHVKEAKRRRIATVTIELQKRTLLSAPVYRDVDLHANLHSALCHLPSNKAFETYASYEAMMLPILEEAVLAMSARRLRREAFLSFQSKDKALDLICSKVCGGFSVSKVQMHEDPRVLVAFGNGGTVSTTGCGYAPTPQARLRHRLKHVWGAHISLINEFRTSKCCCQCGETLSCIFKKQDKGVILKKAVKIHGVLRCKDRGGTRGHGFVHRDKNAAVNIMSIYEALADETKKERPLQFRPERGSRYS
jgi:hypothetical protein